MSARKRNWILALLFLGWALGNLDRYIMNYAVLSITEDLNLSASSTGILLSSFFAGYALMQLPGGWLADRFGARKVLITSVILWSIFTGLTGAAWSLTSMIMIRFLFGIGEGGFQPASSKIISQVFPARETGWGYVDHVIIRRDYCTYYPDSFRCLAYNDRLAYHFRHHGSNRCYYCSLILVFY